MLGISRRQKQQTRPSEPHGHTDLFKCEHIVTLQNSGGKKERLTFHHASIVFYTTQKRDRTVGTTYSSVLSPVPS